jgi:transposase InsO family protein
VDLAKELIKRKKDKIIKIARALRVSRTNLYKNPKARAKNYKRKDDEMVLKNILEVTKTRSTYGYPRVTALINRERKKQSLIIWNDKRIYRVMKVNQLLVPKERSKKPKRLHLGNVITLKSNTRWCSDIFTIMCWNGERVQVGFSLDCHDREAIAWIAEKRPFFHGDIIRLMDLSVTNRFGEFIVKLPHTIQWLTDQGPQYTAHSRKIASWRWYGFIVAPFASHCRMSEFYHT